MLKYCQNLFQYGRRSTVEVTIGSLQIGGQHPVAIQSMVNTPTDNIERSVAQILRIAEAGGELIRLTVQGTKEVEALEAIAHQVKSQGYPTPLVADIHFNPNVAYHASRIVEKVRINPGNFAAPENIDEKFRALINLCKANHTALRIGVNHGSLSDSIMEKWGNSPRGMVESALEYLRICRQEQFSNVVVSFKSSNVRTMVEAYRLGAAMMDAEELNYPLHLGVTEAGADDDGRIRSAVGIGALLSDGLGDTIRVSLTEEPEAEIPVAQTIVEYCSSRTLQNYIPVDEVPLPYNPYLFNKRSLRTPQVIDLPTQTISPSKAIRVGGEEWVKLSLEEFNYEFMEWLEQNPERTIVVTSENNNWIAEIRAIFVKIMRRKLQNPVILQRNYEEHNPVELKIKAAIDFGSILIDGMGDGVWIENFGEIVDPQLGLAILQATGMRISKTEIISCPGCGRTLFDLPTTARQIKERFGNRPGLKIAVMGCIVNGPGEMADADYGYVGSGSGRVTLYRGQQVIERNIPESEAIVRLEELINSDQVLSPAHPLSTL